METEKASTLDVRPGDVLKLSSGNVCVFVWSYGDGALLVETWNGERTDILAEWVTAIYRDPIWGTHAGR